MSLAVIATVAAVAGVGMSAYSMSQQGGGGGEMVQETAQGRKAADIAAEQYNTYLSEIKPTEEKFIADVMKPTDLQEAKQAGKVNADMAQKNTGYFSNNTPDGLTRNLTAPSKGGMNLSVATTKAQMGVQDKKIAGMQAITDIGEGKRSQANLGMNSVAADAQRQAIATAQANENKSGSMIKGAGSLIGAIGGVAKNWPTDPVYQGSPYVGAYSSMGLTYQPASGGMAPGYIYTNPAEVGPPISAMMVT